MACAQGCNFVHRAGMFLREAMEKKAASGYSIQLFKSSVKLLRLTCIYEIPPTHNSRSRDVGGVGES